MPRNYLAYASAKEDTPPRRSQAWAPPGLHARPGGFAAETRSQEGSLPGLAQPGGRVAGLTAREGARPGLAGRVARGAHLPPRLHAGQEVLLLGLAARRARSRGSRGTRPGRARGLGRASASTLPRRVRGWGVRPGLTSWCAQPGLAARGVRPPPRRLPDSAPGRHRAGSTLVLELPRRVGSTPTLRSRWRQQAPRSWSVGRLTKNKSCHASG